MLKTYFDHFLRLLDTKPPEIACPEIVRLMPGLLTHPATAAALSEQGRVTLHEQIGGLTMLGHWHPETNSAWSFPHDHGRTWALYGVVAGRTAMYVYEVAETFDKPRRLYGKKFFGHVRLINKYWIMPGQAFWYPTGSIHSHQTYEDSKLIRLEGFNLHRKELKPRGRKYLILEDSV